MYRKQIGEALVSRCKEARRHIFTAEATPVLWRIESFPRWVERVPAYSIASFTFILMISMISLARADSLSAGDSFLEDFVSSKGTEIVSCGTALKKSFSAGGNCLSDRTLDHLTDMAVHALNQYGQEKLGENFRLSSRLNWSVDNGGAVGEFDVVAPLNLFATPSSRQDGPARAFFLQQGITRWTDDHGLHRNDLRAGGVYRFSLSPEPGADVLGVATFLQQNLERAHGRVVGAVDYAGSWGTGYFHWFSPITGWQPGRIGYEERAAEGMVLGARLDLTNTLSFDTAFERWESADSSRRWLRSGRAGVEWRPHPWLKLNTQGNNLGSGEDSYSMMAAVTIPLGGNRGKSLPAWEGLGLTGGKSAVPQDLFRPIENIGPLRVVEREKDREDVAISGAQVRFLQDNVFSGGHVALEVILPVPAPRDTNLIVRLVPGVGKDTAVPGEDYVDGPVKVTVSKGMRSVKLTIRLLHNLGMTGPRTLNALVFPAT